MNESPRIPTTKTAEETFQLLSADARLVDSLTPEKALRKGVLPISRNGSVTLIASPSISTFRSARASLEAMFGPVALVPSSVGTIHSAVTRTHGQLLVDRSIQRTRPEESCRNWSSDWATIVTSTIIAIAVFFAILSPTLLAGVLIAWASLTLLAVTGLRLAGALVQIRAARRLSRNWRSRRALTPRTRALPLISLLIPLFREREIATHLVKRLEKLDYPRDRLEALLILEADDDVTAQVLASADLPDWMQIVQVPRGPIRTKPRALNYALDFAGGNIIGIYDAEDAPAPDQLLHVANAFAEAPPSVACLQGVLDFYNARQSWLTRCFTIDYAAWFRLILPGLVRLGFAIPLGGTTVFLKRDVLEKIGRWDAHNVTEDADLGIRLARRGYRTEFIPSVTLEEATTTVPAWLRQRSRWIKGYAVTWAVHMRRPLRLYHELGARRFWGFHALFFGALSQFALAPILWSFWLLIFGLPHPINVIAPQEAVVALAILFFATEAVTIATLALAVATPRHRGLVWWVPLMHLYFPLSAIACWKGFAELVSRPFFWDKTAHGQSLDGPVQLHG